ncbi:MAG: transposase [Desulfobacterales bacterium]|uniref:Transposase n=1 Tax=Candidatus Desulfatibia vada TaxID=2841696 RepID=A0A8J6TM93_9BACT|nr:transposase [Candidatus Desulfatibia vada]
MTGYAVTFNRRHRRAGHLFQNRYKSVVCEEENYLLELTRYIHLNPLRAGLVEDLNTLDKYVWSGHSVLMGKLQNPLIPEMKETSKPERQGQLEKPSLTLAEKTVDEVLRHFGNALNDARQHYRAFVEKGIKQGRRPELQGGGLVRSAGGDTSVLFSKDKENRELSDQRILGGGDFVGEVLQESEKLLEKKYKPKRTIDDLIVEVADNVGISPELICSGSRKRLISDARALLAYLAVEETGHKATDVARILGIKRVSVHHAVKKGKKNP